MLVICPHPVGYAPGQRLKYEQYFDYFREQGYDLTVSPFMSERFQKIVYQKGRYLEKAFWTLAGYARRVADLFRIRRYDVVYTFLWVAPFAPPVFEKLTRKLARRMVYDIDDLVFLTPPSSTNPLVHYLRSPKNHISLMKSADHVITCTPYLDQFVRKYNQRTTDISSTVDTDRYLARTDYSAKDPMIIGWSGSHSTSKYLHLLADVLRELATRYRFRLVVMGDADFRMEGVDLEALPWKAEHEVAVISRFDIGVYPLPDEQWVYGKSGLKAIQYMAMGIPTVATAIGANFRVIEDGVSGFLVNSREAWVERLSQLLEDEALRSRIGTAARRKVEAEFSLHANAGTYLRILNDL
ncbi:MAG TPA: glycosyltransferase family 4 protein [Chitinophagaceae bacterium]|jgi:glycosyltransferase involved in cell wall biosynthesis|nr:glycosyltransferase family 4 protein [Chitinophagaceae bacterium]